VAEYFIYPISSFPSNSQLEINYLQIENGTDQVRTKNSTIFLIAAKENQ